MPCSNHSHRETRKSVWMCAESTATVIVRGDHRGTVRHASAHTEQRPQPAEQKQRGEKNDPKSRQHLLAWRASCSRVTISARDASQRPAVAKAFLQSTVQIPIFCVLEKQKEEHREAHQHSKRHSWMAAKQAVRPQPQQSRTVAAHTHPQKTKGKKAKQKKEKHGGRVGLCVCGAAGVCQPWPQRKQNKRERNVCSAPQALVARPHVTAPSARRSSRPLLMRAAGEAHRAVVMSVSVGVRVEQLGGKHTAPLAGRVQQQTIKRKKSQKKKRPQ
ncbi:hypothetical protein TCSYLVIO_006709 [Trypanosoma cruzi]|nr:hypothetical protein TCSYLVIO_006709 [Trypanosoma cruzi]